MADELGLFSGASAQGADTGVQERRSKLYNNDTAAAQLLNPYGVSTVQSVAVDTLWQAVKAGNKKCEYHSELADTTPDRQGIGLSRAAETLLAGIEQLESENVAKLIKEEYLQAALEEAGPLKKALVILNTGKTPNAKQQSGIQGLKKRRVEPNADRHSDAEIKAAATKFYEWLTKPTSSLRGIFAVLSQGGAFYVSTVTEKTCRGWAASGITKDQAIAAALARYRPSDDAPAASSRSATDDAAGLFTNGGSEE